jgi:hypothetical protein
MEYKVIYSLDKFKFEIEVTEHINQGWELQGGVHIVKDGTIHFYYQSIVKK